MNHLDPLLTTFMPAVAVAPALLMLLAMLVPMRQRSGDPLTPHAGWSLLRRSLGALEQLPDWRRTPVFVWTSLRWSLPIPLSRRKR